MLVEYSATVTTDASNNATVYLGNAIRGELKAIKYVPGTLVDTADLTFTSETTGQTLLVVTNASNSASAWYRPLTGAVVAGNAAASTLSEVPLFLYKERIKLVVAQGGATKTGTVYAYVDEEQ